jgi:periplasmic protein TonB
MTQQKKWIRYIPWITGALGVIAFVAVVLWVRSLIPDETTKPKKMVQQITVIAPPPPPPPEVKPPEPEEPEMKEEEIVEETPDEPMPEAAEDTPAGEDLGIDAEGGAGGDAFGLVGRKGGRGLLAGGGGGYAALGQRAINDAILEDKKLRRYQYRAVLKVWYGPDGSVSRYEVDLASGDELAKTRLELLLSKLDLGTPPPPEMKQPAKYRINSKL